MSSSLIIFIDENTTFDKTQTIQAILSLDSISKLNTDREELTDSCLYCEYDYEEDSASIWLGESLKSIGIRPSGKASLDFALKLQSLLDVPLTATDTEYSFQAKLKNIASLQELEDIMSSGIYME